MNKIFYDIVTNVCNEVQDTSTAFREIVKQYVNKRYAKIKRYINWEDIYPDYSLTTVAGTQDYAMNDDFAKPLSVYDTTSNQELSFVRAEDLARDYGTTLTTSGTVLHYTLYNSAVRLQPSSAVTVSVVSSSASDASSPAVVIRYINSSGCEVVETLTLTGTVAVSTTATVSRILGISKPVTVGSITVSSTAGTHAILCPYAKTAQCVIMRLHQIPTQALTIKIPYYRKNMELYDNYDYPVLDLGDLIESGAKADAWKYKKQFAKAQVFELEFSQDLERYIFDQENKTDRVPQFVPATFNRNDLV